jgi:hypothetical protein
VILGLDRPAAGTALVNGKPYAPSCAIHFGQSVVEPAAPSTTRWPSSR